MSSRYECAAKIARFAVVAGTVWVGACVQGPVLEQGAASVSNDALRAAIEGSVGVPSLGAARVERAYRWHPTRSETVLVWITCRGAGDSRACVAAAGRVRAGRVVVMVAQPVGWSVPQIGETANPGELVVSGDDGRGTWRQAVRYETDHGGAVFFERKLYSDGM
jgi:hypothetical protein